MGHFSSKISKERQLQSMAIVIGPFHHKNWRGGYWQHLVSTGQRYVLHSWSYTRRFASELMSFGHLGAAIWHRWTIICYADKSETIDALKDNIREAIGEIQLHTIDVLKNWIDRIGYCMVSRGSHLNEIIFHY